MLRLGDGKQQELFFNSLSTCWGGEEYDKRLQLLGDYDGLFLFLPAVYENMEWSRLNGQHCSHHAEPRSLPRSLALLSVDSPSTNKSTRNTHSDEATHNVRQTWHLLTRCFFSLSLLADTMGTLIVQPTAPWLQSCLLLRVFRITGPMVCGALLPPAEHVHRSQTDMFIPPKSTCSSLPNQHGSWLPGRDARTHRPNQLRWFLLAQRPNNIKEQICLGAEDL